MEALHLNQARASLKGTYKWKPIPQLVCMVPGVLYNKVWKMKEFSPSLEMGLYISASKDSDDRKCFYRQICEQFT